MKKISAFLATILFFLAVAVVPVGIQKVEAFPVDDISDDGMRTNKANKAGTQIYVYFSVSGEIAPNYDLTSAKIGLCPVDNPTLAAAVCTWDVGKDEITESGNGDDKRVQIDKHSVKLEKDIPEGTYSILLFDAKDKKVDQCNGNTYRFIGTPIINFQYTMMNDDGYVYAYVYESEVPDGIVMNESVCPTLYSKDKQTPITEFDAVTLHQNTEYENSAGAKAWVYRMKMLDKTAFELDSRYKAVTAAYSKINNSFIQDSTDEAGVKATYVRDLNVYAPEGKLIVSPFDQKDDSSNETPSDNNTTTDDSQSGSTTETPSTSGNTSTSTPAASTAASQTTAAPAEPEIAVTPLTDSTIPEVQASIDILKKLVEEISSSPADVVSTLKAYAAGIDFSSVTAGGTLDISVTNGADISSGKPITFTDDKIAANVTSTDRIVVLHVRNDGTIECVPATAGDGCITATFNSLSPVAWFKVSNAEKVTAVSPKTGESFWSFIMH